MRNALKLALAAASLIAFNLATQASEQDAVSLSPISFEEFFINPGESSKIRFAAPKGFSETELDFELSSYFKKSVGAGKLRKDSAEGSFVAELSLPQGFYELSVPATKQVFGITSLPAFAGKRDPFFSIETLVKKRADANAWLRLLKRLGVDCVREWESWESDEREEGKLDVSREGFYKDLAAEGLKGISCFGRFPEWTGAVNAKGSARKPQPYPKRILETERSILEMARLRGPGLAAFQIGNEPDLRNQPGDGLMPIAIASSWFFAKNKIETPIAGAAFALDNPAALKSYFQNGFLDYCDIFAFHTYRDPEDMIPRIKVFRDAMKGHPKAAMPIWITESGKPWNRGLKKLNSTYGGPRGNLRAKPEEDKVSALWIAMKAVEAKAGGIERYFPFTMRFFEENNNNFGMFDFNNSPMRSIAAYAVCVEKLANMDYAGDLKPLPAGLKSARVFMNDGNAVAVLYTGKADAVEIDLKEIPFSGAESLDGQPLAPEKGKPLKIEGGMAYLSLERAEAARLLDADTEAMELFRLAKSYKRVPRKTSPALFQFAHWNVESKSPFAYRIDSGEIELNAINLSDDEIRIAPEFVLPEGAKVLASPFSGKEIQLKPRSSTPLAWKFDFAACENPEFDLALRDANGLAPDLVIPIISFEGAVAKRLDAENPARWRANSSGEMSLSYDEAEKALKVQTDFSKTTKDFWAYPELLLKTPEESLGGALAVSFEIKAKQGNGSPFFQHSNFMLAYDTTMEKGKYDAFNFAEPTTAWERRTVYLSPELAAKASMIKIGMGPADEKLDFWIRDLKVLFKPTKKAEGK